MKQLPLWLLLVLISYPFLSKSQSPGGVSTNLRTWVKGDVGVTGTTNVSVWADQSGLGNNFSQGTVANQPSLVTNDINGYSTINFSGSTTIMTPGAAVANLNTTVFTVALPNVNSNWRTMFRGTTNDHPLIIQSGGTTLGYYDNDNGGLQSSGFTWLQNEVALVGLEMRAGDVNFRKNGTQGASITTINLAGLNLNFFGNYQGNNQPFGRIAETIIYNSATALTTTEKERIESYLAIKYGLTLAHNYLASNGSVLWDITSNVGYNNNVTGIGRDDASALDQQASSSLNTTGSVRMDKGGAFSSDLSYIMWGDNGATGSSSNVPSSYFFRSSKIWRAAVSGTPGNVTLSVNLQTIGFPVTASATDYVLLKDTDSDFSSGAIAHTTGASLVGNTLTFTGVSFNNGDYFAIAAVNVGLPGGVAGPVFWVKGDVGVTGTTDVSSWADQSGSSTNATQATLANQPSQLTNDLNFHSTIDFSGNTDYFSITNAPANLNSTVFTVAVPRVNSNWRTMFRGTTSDHPLIIQSGGTALGYYDGDNIGFKSSGFTWLQNEAALVGLEMKTGDVNFRKNGVQGSSIATINLAGLNLNSFGNFTTNSQQFGRIAETIIYNSTTPLTATEKEKIESYLAIKYGITLSHNYLASDGTVLWNVTTNATYNNNVTGIGRDDLSSLDQQKSLSVNTAGSVTLDKGASFPTDKNFILFGDDAGAGSSSNVSNAYAARAARIWKTAVTNTPGSVNFSINLQTIGFPNTNNAADYVLLKDTDTDFSAGTTPHSTGVALVGNTLSFTGVTFNDGDFFTIAATNLPLPGGIAGNLTVWLKANNGLQKAGNIAAANGDAVVRWVDQSGFGRDYTAVAGPTLQSNTLNFNPSAEILAGGFDAPAGSELSNNWTVFFISQKLASDNNGRLFDGHTSNYLWAHWGTYTNSIYLNNLPSNYNSGIATTTGIQNLHLHSFKRESAGGTLEARADGSLLSTFGSSNSANGIRIDINAGQFAATESSNSRVGEMIIYNSALTSSDVNKIESYLGIKYGITLTHDYVATNGTTLWNVTTNAGFNNNITGIGRDDEAALSQPKSLSMNATGSVTLDKGGVFGTNKDFILWGDNGLTGTSANVSSTYSARSNKIWKASVKGTPGAVDFSVNLLTTGFPNSGNAANYVILKDTDTDFSSGATTHSTGASIVGNTLSFTGVTFNDGEFFAIAASNIVLPGGVTGTVFWVKGDVGVTVTTDVSNWADQSGIGNDAFQNTAANQPSLLNNAVNFHAAIDFSGSTDVMTPITAPANLNTTVFTVAIPNVNTNWRTMFRGTVNDHPIIIQANGTQLGYYDNDNVGFKTSGFNWLQNETALVALEMRTGDVNFRKNGAQGASINSINLAGLNLNNFGNFQGGTQPFGKIAETIIFNTSSPLTTTEKEKIESYLGVKYGLTLTHNYVAGDASVYWDVTNNSGYNNNITGVGRDDVSGLDQRKSKSSNSGSVLTIEKTSSFATNKDFWMAGDDGGSLGASTTNTHPSYPMRVTRIWRADLNGTPGVVDISFDLGTGIYNSGLVTDYALLFKTGDSNFSAGATAYTTGASIVSNVITFTNVPIADGDFFTLALPRVVAPGGVINGLNVWLKADAGVYSDAGVTLATDGGTVQRWGDQTTLSNHATNTGTPVWNSSNNLINFNPTLYYDGASGHNLTYSSTNQYTVVTMGRMEGTQNRRMFSSRTGNVLLGTWNGREDVFYLDNNPSLLTGLSASTNPKLYVTTRASSGAYQFLRNGFTLYSGASSFNSTVRLGIANGGAQTAEASKAFVSEVIQYDRDLSAIELNRVNSYMAIKYGVSLDQITPTNYVSANGTVVWDATVNSGYKFNIAGIGRDDASGLTQPKSKSINAGAPVIVDKGGAFTSDLDFMVWGSNSAYLTPTNINAHPSYPYRLGKIWRMDISGTPGTVSVSFDLSTGIHNTNNPADYALLIKNADNNFSAGATAHTTGAAFNGTILTFTGVNFTDGDYFTLALPNVPAPGGVVNDMTLWLKSDKGVSGVANASEWDDQSGNGFNLLQTTAGNQPAIQTNRINFNPTLQFDGSNDYLSLTGGILGNANTFTDVNAFVVSRTNTISNSSIFFETTSGAGPQFNFHSPWGDNNLYWDAGNTGTNRLAVNWGGNINTPFLWALQASTTATTSGARQDIYRNGFRIANDNTMSSFTGNNNNLFIGSSSTTTNFYNGDIGEVIVYTGPLTTIKTQQIQSYLALKYGITITAFDYLSSAGTSIYRNTTAQASYARDIAGIARDDNSALDQRKSKTINATGDLITIANGNFTTPTAFANNLESLVWGHNGLVTQADAATPSYTHNGVTVVRQIARVWSTEKIGTPAGNAIVEVDMSTVIGPSGAGTNNTADIRLLVDNDATFGNSSAGERAYNSTSITGNKIYFSVPYVDIPANQGFFTIGSVNATTAPLTTPSPGGLAVDLRLWIKADAGVTGGANAATWTDQGPNAFVLNQANGANQPTVLATGANGNPAIQFDGVSDDMAITNGVFKNLTHSDVYIYAVSKALTIKNAKLTNENTVSGTSGFYAPWVDNNIYWDAGDAGANNRLVTAWGATTNIPYLWSAGASTTATPSSAKQDILRNGLRLANDNTFTAFTGNNTNFTLGSQAGSNYYNGELSEMIIITSSMTSSQQLRLHSYLAVKYGITLDQTTPQNYVASDGTVIYDAVTANSGFRSDIAGIGRDDISALDQRKSQSVNPRSAVQIDKGGAFASDKTFLMWGSDNGALGLTTTNAHPSLTYRTSRTWRTDFTGTPGAVNVIFDLSAGIYNSGSAADYLLLVKNTNSNFSTGATTYTGTLVGSLLTFSGISFADGDYFSLGVANMPAPGGVVPNLHYWVKADAGVTGATTVSAWADQSGNGFNVSQATAASQPSLQNNRTNFNPALQFDGANDQLTLFGGIMGTSTYTDFHAIMVARTNTVTSSSAFFETQASGGRINIHLPWSDNNLYWDAGSAGGSQRLNTPWGGTVATNYVWSFTSSTTSTPSGARQDIYRNGRRIANDNTMASFTGNNSNFVLGSQNGANFFNGDLDEVVFYKGVLSLSQLQRIQSYLAIKYGITLDQTTPQNYVASDWNGTTGTIVWDATAAGVYKNDIAVIGRDDNSALSQKQSASVNANNVLSIGNAAIAADNSTNSNSFTTDKSFFSWGHNNQVMAALTGTDFGTTLNAEVIKARLARTWFSKETGNVGTLKLRFNMANVVGVSGFLGNNDLNDVRLLVDADGVFATGSTSVAPSSVNNTTDIVEFDYDFAAGTGFYFSIGSVNLATAPLPVELISFAASPDQDGVILKWATASELNNHYFEVESSIDGKNWNGIMKVDGQGTKRTRTDYLQLDATPYLGISYYRLKQVDYDGKSTYSNTEQVDFQNAIKLTVSPNPSNGSNTVKLKLNAVPSGSQLLIRVTSLQGIELVRHQIQLTEKNSVEQQLDVKGLANGTYLITAEFDGQVRQAKLIVTH